jgi:indole-3-glycerol phosphate synthase
MFCKGEIKTMDHAIRPNIVTCQRVRLGLSSLLFIGITIILTENGPTNWSTAFSPQQPQWSTPTKHFPPLYAIGALVKKSKLLEIQKMKEQPLPSDVAEYYARIQEFASPDELSSSVGPLQEALTKRKGTLTVIAEYKRRPQWDLELLSPLLRKAGATALAVLADARMGNCTYTHLRTLLEEQRRIRLGNLIPGPMFVVNSDVIVDSLQIAQTAALALSEVDRVAAVVLQYSILVSSDNTDTTLLSELLQATRAVGIEAIVTVSNAQQAQTAIALGASILCTMAAPLDAVPDSAATTTTMTTNNTFVDAQVACIADVGPQDRPMCYLAHVPVKAEDSQWTEIEDVWYLRDTHMFQGIYVSDVLYQGAASMGSNDALEHPGSILQAMRSKSSRQWGVVTTQSGRGEGAREYLGDILM